MYYFEVINTVLSLLLDIVHHNIPGPRENLSSKVTKNLSMATTDFPNDTLGILRNYLLIKQTIGFQNLKAKNNQKDSPFQFNDPACKAFFTDDYLFPQGRKLFYPQVSFHLTRC